MNLENKLRILKYTETEPFPAYGNTYKVIHKEKLQYWNTELRDWYDVPIVVEE